MYMKLALTVYHPYPRYSLRAKRVFSELHEKAFIVELDLRGNWFLMHVFNQWQLMGKQVNIPDDFFNNFNMLDSDCMFSVQTS